MPRGLHNQAKNAKTLGQITDTLVEVGPKFLSLEDAMERFKSIDKKKAYYFDTSHDGYRLFGVVGSTCLVKIPEKVYIAIGSPDAGQNIPFYHILREAGYTV